MRYSWLWIMLCGLGTPALAAPESGDVFREYVWAGPWINASRWQRVTGPDATPERARAHLPNPVNQIKIDDLNKARKTEITIEMLLCHGVTFRIYYDESKPHVKGIISNPHSGERLGDMPVIECRTASDTNVDHVDVIGINGRKVVTKVGKNHDLSYDSFAVPVEYLVPENTLYTYSDTHHHGLEVQWPGMVLFVQYDEPEPLPL